MYAEHLTILGNVALWLFAGILSVAALVVGWQVTTSKINLSGLMYDKSSGAFSPGRLQLLLFTLLVAVSYMMALTGFAVPGSLIEAPGKPDLLPNIDKWVVSVLGGSSASYLGGKSVPTLSHLISSLLGRTS
jgi:hypothetical protein